MVNVETIRYYEGIGLLAAPPRTAGGHRLYPDKQLKRLAFIRRSRELGFSLDEIRNLLGLVEGGYTCGQVQEAALTHLGNIRRKIADLRRMGRSLAETAERCRGEPPRQRPIIDALRRPREGDCSRSPLDTTPCPPRRSIRCGVMRQPVGLCHGSCRRGVPGLVRR